MAKVRINGDTSGYIELASPAAAGSNTLTLPSSNGSANQLLKNSGTAGTLAWSTLTEDSSGNLNIDSGTLYVDASNNRVGVGTTSPGRTLDVIGSIRSGGSTNPYVALADGTTEAYFEIASSTTRISSGTSQPLTFRIGSSEAARIDTSNRLLLGTSTSPSVGDSQYSLISILGSTAGSTTDAYFSLRRGQAPGSIANGSGLGTIVFGANDGSPYAAIAGQTDGTGSSGDYPGRLVLSVTQDSSSSPAERLRIANDGRMNYLDASTEGFGVRSTSSASSSLNLIAGWYGATTVLNGTASFVVRTNGNVLNTNNSYTGLSDIKLKENVVNANSQWDDIKALRVRNYNFKEGQVHRQIGLIAQEVEKISPGLVLEANDRDTEGNDLGTVTKSVNYSVLYMKAVKALQEAMERIENLEAKVAALEGV
jgi:hypothetical protein